MNTRIEQIKEYAKIIKDAPYALRTYLQTYDNTQKKFVPLELFPDQIQLIQDYEKYNENITRKYRQAGVSTVTAAWISKILQTAKPENPERVLIIAKEVNMVPDELIGNLGDCHIYLNQIEGVKEQIGRDLTEEERYDLWFANNYETGMEKFFDPNNLPNYEDPYYEPTPKRTREPFPLPTLKLHHKDPSILEKPQYWRPEDFTVENYKSHPKIYFPLSN